MTQYEAIVSIQELLPLMREARDPGQVLTKYARENQLSGAQLEKLAHVYNTQLHVTHLEKCAAHEKGADLELLDPVQLVRQFHQYEAPPDAQHIKTAGQLDQASYSDSDPYRFVQKSRDRADRLVDRADELLGSLLDSPDPAPNPMHKLAAQAFGSVQERDQDMDALLEQAERAEWGRQACLQKLAAVVRREGPFSFMDVERACLYATRQPTLTRENMDELERMCKQAGQIVFRAQDPQVPDTYTPDHLGVYGLARQLNSQTLEGRAARLVWESKKRDLEDPFLKLGVATFPDPANVYTDAERKKIQKALGGRTFNDFMLPYKKVWEKAHGDAVQRQRELEKREKEEEERIRAQNEARDKKLDAYEKGWDQTGTSVQTLLANTSQAAQTGLRETREQIPDQSAALNTYLTLMGSGKNEREKAVRDGLSETVASTALQNVLMRDRVVRQADPNQVVRLYESIRQIRPEVVQNEPLLTFMLREALQYDALPLHTVSALEQDRKAKADSLTREREYRTERDRTLEQVGSKSVRA